MIFRGLFFFFFLNSIYAKQSDISNYDLSDFISHEKIENIIYKETTGNKDWIFILAEAKGVHYENLYAVNLNSPEKSRMILENPAHADGIFSNLCYLPETETLYFSIHNGKSLENGVQLFYGEGIYVLKKDSDGNYSSKGLRRFSKLEPWLVRRARSAWFENLPEPDYSVFLKWLFGFCDYDVQPCFVYRTEGKSLLNEEALRYLYENNLIDDFFESEKEGYRSGFENCLFCLDENHNPTGKSAVTANHCPGFFKEGKAFAESHYFVSYNGRVFMLENIGSMKKTLDSRGNVINTVWSPDFSRIYSIYDSEKDFGVYQNSGYEEIRGEVFETPFPSRKDTAPAFFLNRKFYIRDVNHSDFYELQRDFSFKKNNSSNITGEVLSPIVLILPLSLLVLLCLALAYALFKINSPKNIFLIEEKLRSKISSDIHDTVVQDIRAIRLDLERLKVQQGNEELQKSAVQNITSCIKKMRDICYSLNPAEIANAEISGSKVDIISVLHTLCEQFSESSKIVFTLDCDKELSPVCINQDMAKYITRIVQEILSNIQKHSFASKFTLSIRKKMDEEYDDKTLTLIFIDDGVGCNLEKLSKKEMKKHFGMRNMKQLALLCGGKIEFLSAPDEGMQVRLTISLEG